MKKNAIARLESMKQEVLVAINSGKFSTVLDSEGINAQTRLSWVQPSIDYINGVAASLPEKELEAAVEGIETSCDDELMLAYVGCVYVMSKDCYVQEGRHNIEMALEILAQDEVEDVEERAAPVDDVEEPEDECKSLFQQGMDFVKGLGKKKKGKAKAKPEKVLTPGTVKLEKPANTEELKELKAKVAKLEAAKADADARAEAAEAEVRKLKSKLRELGIAT